jgi:hypothetical protein
MTRTITGSCLCGEVRYELTQAPLWAHHCHCSRCRKSGGGAFASNLFFPLEALRYTQGESQLRSYKPPDAERFTHVFCSRCGSTMPFASAARGLVGVPMGSLDEDPDFTPRAHIFVDSKAPWWTISDELPQHPTSLGSARAPDA